MNNETHGLAPLEVAKLAKGLSEYLGNCVSKSDLPSGIRKLYVGISNMLKVYIGIFEKIKATLDEMGLNTTGNKMGLQVSLEESCELDTIIETLKGMLTKAKEVAETNLIEQIALLSVYYSQFVDVLNATIEMLEKEKKHFEEDVELYQCDVCGFISIRERPVRCPVCNESGKNFKVL